MFNNISWYQFFITLIVITVVYYLITTLLIYSDEVKSFFKKNSDVRNDDNTSSRKRSDEYSLMGEVRHSPIEEEIVSRGGIIDQQQLAVNTPTEADETPDDLINVRSYYSLVDIVIEEINALIEVVADQSKEESASLFKSLLARHDSLNPEQRDLITITLYNQCKSRCSFPVELSEIISWWPASASNNKSN